MGIIQKMLNSKVLERTKRKLALISGMHIKLNKLSSSASEEFRTVKIFPTFDFNKVISAFSRSDLARQSGISRVSVSKAIKADKKIIKKHYLLKLNDVDLKEFEIFIPTLVGRTFEDADNIKVEINKYY